jgi:RHS repeat-associated protein
VEYFYDEDGLLTDSGAFTITRNAGNGLPESVTDGTVVLTRAFSGYSEMDGQEVQAAGTSLYSFALTRDNAGRIVARTDTVGGVATEYAYGYDELGRLVSVSKDGSLVESYQYGPNGARTLETNLLRGIASRSLTYSEEDHLLTAGEASYLFDPDGFLTQKTRGSETTRYMYSSRGELLSAVLPDGTSIAYLYDPLGRRIARKVNGTVVEKYLWQGQTRLLAVYDGSNVLLMRFDYADGRMPVAMTKGGTNYYLAYDPVGSLRVVSDAAGNIVKRVDYDSFGNILADSNPSFTVPFGFAGGLHDPATGLVRFGYRDYDPDTGRWTAKDPIFFAGGDTDLFGYAQQDPVNLVDPEGLFGVIGTGFTNTRQDSRDNPVPNAQDLSRVRFPEEQSLMTGRAVPGQFGTIGLNAALEAGKTLSQEFGPVIRNIRYGTPVIIVPENILTPKPAEAAACGG